MKYLIMLKESDDGVLYDVWKEPQLVTEEELKAKKDYWYNTDDVGSGYFIVVLKEVTV